MITLKDVAEKAGVSISTASRAFRQDVYISDEKKALVLSAAEEMGYTPNFAARSLRGEKSSTIGLILITSMYHLEYYIEQALKPYGYRLLITYSDGDPKSERSCMETLISSQVDGMICFFSNYDNQDLIDQCMKNGVRILQLFGQQYDCLPTVIIDDETMTYELTRYLIACGHRHILFPEHRHTIYKHARHINGSFYGYKRALNEIGETITQKEYYCLPLDKDTKPTLSRIIRENNPTVFIATNDEITIAALEVLNEFHLTAGNSISFVAYDDSPWCEYLGITAYHHDFKGIGQYCARKIVQLIQNQESTPVFLKRFSSPLIKRNSVCSII